MSASCSLAATISRAVEFVFLAIKGRRMPPGAALTATDFELPAENPVEQAEQHKRRADEHAGVERKDTDLRAEISLFRTEKYVRFSAAPIIVLLHLRVGDQVGNLLIYVELLGRDRAN